MHILIFREKNGEAFTKDMFSTRYHKMDPTGVTYPPYEVDNSVPFVDPEDDTITTDEVEHTDSLDEREKYRIVSPILLRISGVLCVHSTKNFLQYVDEIEKVENRIREGKPIFKALDSDIHPV